MGVIMAIIRWVCVIVSLVFLRLGYEEDVYYLNEDGKWKRNASLNKRKPIYKLIAFIVALIYIVLLLLTKRNVYFLQKTVFLLGIIMLLYSCGYMSNGSSCYISNRRLAKFLKIFWVGIACITVVSNVYYFCNIEKYIKTDIETTTYTISSEYKENADTSVTFGPDTFLSGNQDYQYYKVSDNGNLEPLCISNAEIILIGDNETAKVVIEKETMTYKENDVVNSIVDKNDKETYKYKLYLKKP